MKVTMKALVPALALVGALSLPAVVEAGHRHGPRCGHRDYYSDGYGYGSSGYGYDSDRYYSDGYGYDGYSRGRRHGYYSRPYGYRHRGYRPGYYGYRYAPAPYGYGYGGYYPPPRYRGHRPRVGVSLHFGF